MPYYPTLTEDIARAKEILDKGKVDLEGVITDLAPDATAELREQFRNTVGGAIYGADIYAAYKLLESFVEAIEAVDPKICELALRHRTKIAAVRADVRQALDQHIPGCTCIIVNGEYRSTEVGGCPVHPPGTHARCTSVAGGRRCVLVAHHDASMNATPHDYGKDDRPSITCPRCKMTSYNPKDISERYCGHCHEFHETIHALEIGRVRAEAADECVCRSTHCGHVASKHANGVCAICDKGICWC